MATFAKVERSTRQVYQNLPAQSEVEFCSEQKNRRISPEPCGFELANYFRLIFVNDNTINGTHFARACVINMYSLTWSER